MSVFLFIPSAAGSAPGRRVNFADIANLFAETEPPARRGRASVMGITLTALILLAAIADAALVTRSGALAHGLGFHHAGRAVVVEGRH